MKELKEPSLRILLARSLRHRGFRHLCKGEPSDYTRISVILSQNILVSIIVGINFFFVFHLGLVFWQTGLLTLLTLLLLGLLSSRAAISSTLFYLLYTMTWLILVCVLLYRDGFAVTLSTFGLPFLLTPAAR